MMMMMMMMMVVVVVVVVVVVMMMIIVAAGYRLLARVSNPQSEKVGSNPAGALYHTCFICVKEM